MKQWLITLHCRTRKSRPTAPDKCQEMFSFVTILTISMMNSQCKFSHVNNTTECAKKEDPKGCLYYWCKFYTSYTFYHNTTSMHWSKGRHGCWSEERWTKSMHTQKICDHQNLPKNWTPACLASASPPPLEKMLVHSCKYTHTHTQGHALYLSLPHLSPSLSPPHLSLYLSLPHLSISLSAAS